MSSPRPTKIAKLSHDSTSDMPSTLASSPHADAPPHSPSGPTPSEPPTEPTNDSTAPLSKNALKRLLKQQAWDAGRPARRALRREKLKAKRAAKHASTTTDPTPSTPPPPTPSLPRNSHAIPLTLVLDCSFNSLMTPQELKSLASQITRSYSECGKARAGRPGLAIAGFGGVLKERFEGPLARQHERWRGVRWCEDDVKEVVKRVGPEGWMKGLKVGGVWGEVLANNGLEEMVRESDERARADAPAPTEQDAGSEGPAPTEQEAASDAPNPATSDTPTAPSPPLEPSEIIYLTAESSNVLTSLKPGGVYIIGGLVDRNRHKGICHARAEERGIVTARLPIGEFLQMNSRAVLATNHVVEIMLRWLEEGDWGRAFMSVIPKRKGGVLKGEEVGAEGSTKGDGEEGGEEGESDDEAEGSTKDGAEESKDGGGEHKVGDADDAMVDVPATT
ncbi:hypothetical protein EJ06DRAFT_44353 [Trichodelitschia bisporula]|uniref:tRNA (guanine(9)-N1)-methyltransferase n=1 Tax=Trichodelitschia bisporula TaxID=703511 RepID=A0A6G1HW54_9PEZI|nr:hypothetical protein EJ06DRAFT_44353 [Trichodelitschia bisporula]